MVKLLSPDGKTAYYSEKGAIYSAPISGGKETQVLKLQGHVDGMEYSPDSIWLYFNSDHEGHAQIYRYSIKNKNIERLTQDKYVNWFLHLLQMVNESYVMLTPKVHQDTSVTKTFNS